MKYTPEYILIAIILFTCVDSEGIKVLHVADGHTVVGSISNDLVLQLLPAQQGLLNQKLVRKG